MIKSACAGDALTIRQLLDRIRRSVQGAFANSELPTGEQTVMAGLPAEDEPKLMPFGFAVHDESFFRVPVWHGLQVGSATPPHMLTWTPLARLGAGALARARLPPSHITTRSQSRCPTWPFSLVPALRVGYKHP